MKFSINLKLLILAVLVANPFLSCNTTEKDAFAVMAYYVPSNNYSLKEIPFNKLTHIIFSFTEVIDNKMQFKRESSSQKLKDLVAYKKQHPQLKVMIACGGWGGSGRFSDMANDPKLRAQFVESTIDFIKEYNLDGADMDWEYPGMKGAGNPFMPEDKENFTALMKELREGMDATGKDLTLTFAAAGWERYFDHIETFEVMKYADYLNIMSYDLVGGGTPFTAHHTNLGAFTYSDISNTPADNILAESGRIMKPRSVQSMINYLTELGVKQEQLIIGGAFYGKGWKGVSPENNGLYQKNKGAYTTHIYATLKDKYENKNGFTKHWDSIAQAPYLYNAKDSIFITYDDTESIALKTTYAMKEKLGGIMFWQLTGDTTENGLLDAIYSATKN
ncbi:glycoside hydrolase family 18 protein [Urechidicola vernalis]|uniref:chitinase n=1 Tax=Urechidicola vernalis TaxID=3075600 RepID=A0ABU2Y5P7_9FLAO|nr:glycoside hydrolase family 18 protein [Urechidicola sp. P050]MDT0552388.1 glycoside hydrolase family 18 protein [Urechidicola sp. P050]